MTPARKAAARMQVRFGLALDSDCAGELLDALDAAETQAVELLALQAAKLCAAEARIAKLEAVADAARSAVGNCDNIPPCDEDGDELPLADWCFGCRLTVALAALDPKARERRKKT